MDAKHPLAGGEKEIVKALLKLAYKENFHWDTAVNKLTLYLGTGEVTSV